MTTMQSKYEVVFNNYGEVLTLYTHAASEAQAKLFAAKRFAPMVGRSLNAVLGRMKGPMVKVTVLAKQGESE